MCKRNSQITAVTNRSLLGKKVFKMAIKAKCKESKYSCPFTAMQVIRGEEI
jgi:hypothetical protein